VDHFNFHRHAAAQRDRGQAWSEPLRIPALSVGVYLLAAGARDEQQPHSEDEVYYVVRGQATLRVGSDTRPVAAGDCLLVAAGAEHRFEDIREDLELLVVFAPAYTGR
jgi:mannose-6-phosphate isomerase-like protein (cupin superfamily)